MGIFGDIGEGLALASEAPLLAGLGALALIYPAVSWIRKNAAPRLSEQRQARTFQRVLDTARGLNELAEMKNLTEERRTSLEAALIENGMGLPPRESAKPEIPAETQAETQADAPPPPWFLDRVEALCDAGGRVLAGLLLLGIGVGCLCMVVDIVGIIGDTQSITGTVLMSLLFTVFGLFATTHGLELATTSIGLHLAFIDRTKELLSKLIPPTWLIGLLGIAMKYLGPIGFFAYLLHWALTTTQQVEPAAWVLIVFFGLIAAGVSVKAIQSLRILFHVPEEATSSQPPGPPRGCATT